MVAGTVGMELPCYQTGGYRDVLPVMIRRSPS
jgi:hypothetical protein